MAWHYNKPSLSNYHADSIVTCGIWDYYTYSSLRWYASYDANMQIAVLERSRGRHPVFTWGQFWSSGIFDAMQRLCVCPSIFVSVYQSHAITYDPIRAVITKFGPEVQNTLVEDLYCFLGRLTLTYEVKFNLKLEIYPHFKLLHAWLMTKFAQKMQNTFVTPPTVLGWLTLTFMVKFNFKVKISSWPVCPPE